MNKILILIFSIFLIIKNSNAQAVGIPSASMCFNDPMIIAIGNECNNTGDSCAFGSYCKGSPIGTCTKVTSFGSACSTNEECSPYSCTNNVCSNSHFSIGGQSCSSNNDCWASPIPGQQQTLECVGNKCVIGNGKQCQSPSDCNFNQNCVSSSGVNSCVATSGIDGACNNRYDCNVNLVCTYKDDKATSKTCQTPWTKKLGEKCDNSVDAQRIPFFYDCDIGSGLYCGKDGVCVTNTPSSSCTTCSNTTSCKGFSESCVCNNHEVPKATLNANKVGICIEEVYITNACKSTFGDLINCCQQNSCPMNQQLLFNEGSCAFKNCKANVCKMSNCFRATGAYNMLNLAQTSCGTSYSLPKDFTESCPNGLETKPNNSASMLPSILFAIFFVVTMIILS